MTINANNQAMTPSTFARYVLCKVIEDVDTHYDDYAAKILPEFSNMSENEKAKLNEWKHKEIVKLAKFLRKDEFNESTGA